MIGVRVGGGTSECARMGSCFYVHIQEFYWHGGVFLASLSDFTKSACLFAEICASSFIWPNVSVYILTHYINQVVGQSAIFRSLRPQGVDFAQQNRRPAVGD